MADIAALVQYDKTYPVVIRRLDNGEPVGITINVVSMDSKRVVDALRAVEAEKFASQARGAEVDIVAHVAAMERARLIASIDSWDFGGNTFGDLAADAPCNDANKAYLVDHPNAKWVRDQIAMGCANIANFTQAASKPARNTSKKT